MSVVEEGEGTKVMTKRNRNDSLFPLMFGSIMLTIAFSLLFFVIFSSLSGGWMFIAIPLLFVGVVSFAFALDNW